MMKPQSRLMNILVGKKISNKELMRQIKWIVGIGLTIKGIGLIVMLLQAQPDHAEQAQPNVEEHANVAAPHRTPNPHP